MNEIKFGTDGWRALVGKDFTPENVRKVIQAFCDWRRRIDPNQNKVILGYDRRNQSYESSIIVAEVLAANGFQVHISNQFCPTPCISWMVKKSDAFAGIMITASHNPWQWNGIKFKEEYGGSAAPEYTQQVEKQLIENESIHRKIQLFSFEEGKQKKLISFFDPHQDYVKQLQSLLDIKIIQNSNLKVLVDPLFGAGTGFFKSVVGDQIQEIHNKADIKFGGLNPEPIDINLREFMEKVRHGPWDVGLATDGDADRIGAVDENGEFINSHQIFALLLKHYVEDKGLKGKIIKSVSTTEMISILCKKYGLELIETPIGFKYICKELVESDALMGGEESGGISYAPHVHERDGVLNGLMLLEMMSMRKKKLRGLIDELYADIGTFYFQRNDVHLERDRIHAMEERLKNETIKELAGCTVTSTNFVDGFKYILDDGSWLLVRASGTEPLVRVYAEAHSKERIQKLLNAGNLLLK